MPANLIGLAKRLLHPVNSEPSPRWRLHQYRDYDEYVRVQTAANHKKLHKVWAQRENIERLAAYIRQRGIVPTWGLCHGTRRGLEQHWFSEALGCSVLGTEISDTATQFLNTVQHDFHETRPEWIGKADFIYSNSFDHARDPARALSAWVDCLRPGGLIFIEHSSTDDACAVREMDPFGADLEIMPYLILTWGKGRFFVTDLVELPIRPQDATYTVALVVERRG